MKHFPALILFASFLALLLIGCGASDGPNSAISAGPGDSASGEPASTEDVAEVAATAGFQDYTNETQGISLQYPADWIVLQDDGRSLTLGSEESLASGQIPAGPFGLALLSVTGRGMAGLPEEATSDDLVTYLDQTFTDFGLDSESIVSAPEAVQVAGQPAASGTVQLDDGTANEVLNIFTVFINNDRLVTAINIVPKDSEADFTPLFAAINDSIRIELPDLALVEGVEMQPDLDRGHDSDVVYPADELPPIGGIHNPFWQNCGIYDEPVDSSQAVHSLEHGAVWISYDPELSEADVTHLRDLSRGESYVLMSPYPNLQSPVILSAWGVRLELESAMDERIGAFIERYQAGPQTPEPGASCQNGVGEPIES